MNQMRNTKYLSVAFLGFFLLFNCEDSTEALSAKSVIEIPSSVEDSEAQTFLNENFKQPYNIFINYQWQSNGTFDKTQLYPPNEARAFEVSKALKTIWVDLYAEVAGEEFMKEMAVAEVKLFGNPNIDSFGVEKWQLRNDSPFPLSIFRVDEFERDAKHLTRLSRNIQNNMAKLMMYRKSFDTEAFAKLNFRKYRLSDVGKDIDVATLSPGAFNLGYYSIPASRYDVYEDFAETLSILISYPKYQIDEMIEYAGTPIDDYYKEVERARQAKKTLEAKRDFVTKYLKNEFNIDINVLNLKNLIRIKEYAQ